MFVPFVGPKTEVIAPGRASGRFLRPRLRHHEAVAATRAPRPYALRRDPLRVDAEDGLTVGTANVHESVVASSSSVLMMDQP